MVLVGCEESCNCDAGQGVVMGIGYVLGQVGWLEEHRKLSEAREETGRDVDRLVKRQSRRREVATIDECHDTSREVWTHDGRVAQVRKMGCWVGGLSVA